MDGIECSIEDLTNLPEFSQTPSLRLIGELQKLCDQCSIEVIPPLDSPGCELQTRRMFTRKRGSSLFSLAFKEAIEAGEGHKVEYKQTLALDSKAAQNPKVPREHLIKNEVTHEVIKTIVAFLNADGGTLLIGVSDDSEVTGIEAEFNYLPNGNTIDHWELYFQDKLDSQLHECEIIKRFVAYSLYEIDGINVCVVKVQPRRDRLSSCRPCNRSEDDCIYVREGNRSKRVHIRGIEDLILSRLTDTPRESPR